ncbi:SUZ domain-containing protein 1-like isoform X2 [Pomacea canaliculata]|uniref:SUZ domain-containing protein 1-like isoform X2 n=1 Tax=Pomacea canaliculata TaxID=400727 RepID=UPI000D73C335|nr:SUZ domain-containing protein 1-like isoform X2 [Pomacea canaliculata]
MMAEDSEVLDSWEDQVDSGVLDERLKKISISQVKETKSSTACTAIMVKEDTGRTEYKPQVRILKREPNTAANGVPGNSTRALKANKPMKTLEQREAEYAEARLRIFGQVEADGEQNYNNNSMFSETSASPSIERPEKLTKGDSPKPGANVLRQPRGPDGSRGFSSTR